MSLDSLLRSLPAIQMWAGGSWRWGPSFKTHVDEVRRSILANPEAHVDALVASGVLGVETSKPLFAATARGDTCNTILSHSSLDGEPAKRCVLVAGHGGNHESVLPRLRETEEKGVLATNDSELSILRHLARRATEFVSDGADPDATYPLFKDALEAWWEV